MSNFRNLVAENIIAITVIIRHTESDNIRNWTETLQDLHYCESNPQRIIDAADSLYNAILDEPDQFLSKALFDVFKFINNIRNSRYTN